VRDNFFRGHSAEQTLSMWDSIREGENRNIFPFQENADFMFNSILTYELCVLKKYVKPLLKTITNYSSYYLEAQRLLRLLGHIYNIEDSLVPSNSILREFIGGSIFNY
jgi:uridine kinase